MTLAIRALEQGEREICVAHWQACGLTVAWNDPHTDFEHALMNPTSGVLGGFVDQRGLVATAMYGFEGHRAWLYYVGVAPEFRRSGFARRIVSAAEEQVKALGARKVMLMVREGNGPAHGLYEGQGYEAEPVTTFGKVF